MTGAAVGPGARGAMAGTAAGVGARGAMAGTAAGVGARGAMAGTVAGVGARGAMAGTAAGVGARIGVPPKPPATAAPPAGAGGSIPMNPLETRCVGVGLATGASAGGMAGLEAGLPTPEGPAAGVATGALRNSGDADRAKSAFAEAGSPAMRITAPHTSHRARIPPVGTFAGSIR
ncbi:MAG: hypothetical protein LW922_08660 [Gemmatimonadetes bacterium]|nr:hypothetical protein [Gemmatimonadota bacterium]